MTHRNFSNKTWHQFRKLLHIGVLIFWDRLFLFSFFLIFTVVVRSSSLAHRMRPCFPRAFPRKRQQTGDALFLVIGMRVCAGNHFLCWSHPSPYVTSTEQLPLICTYCLVDEIRSTICDNKLEEIEH